MSQQLKYECPTCKTLNNSEEKNCIKCGHWMLSTFFPPKPIKKKSVIKRIFTVIGISAASIIGLFVLLVIIVAVTDSKKDSSKSASVDISASSKPKYKSGERNNPVPIGKELSFRIEQFAALTGMNKHQFDISLKVNESLRGQVASAKVKGWNKLNADPKDGYEYLLTNITVGVTDSKDDVSLKMNQNMLSLVSGDGIKYDNVFITVSEPVDAEMYKGAKHAGWAAFLVRKNDSNPLIEAAGVWFRAYQ